MIYTHQIRASATSLIITSQKPPVTWDWVMGFTKMGKREPSSSSSSSAFVMAWVLASSVAYTRFSRSFLPYVLPLKNKSKQVKISTTSTNHHGRIAR